MARKPELSLKIGVGELENGIEDDGNPV